MLGLLLAALVILSLPGCSSTPQGSSGTTSWRADVVAHPTFSDQVHVAHWAEGTQVESIQDPSQIGLGFVRPQDRNTPPPELPQNVELRIDEGQPLQLDLVLNTAVSRIFLVTALVDYKQVPFSLDGKTGLLHEVNVEQGGQTYLPVEIEVNGRGAHDLILLAFADPYDRPWDDAYRKTLLLEVGRRAVVIVGDEDRPFRDVRPDVYGAPVPERIHFGLSMAFAEPPNSPEDGSHPSERQMRMAAEGKPGEAFPYQLWVSNYNFPNDVADYAMLRFLDFHQIDFKGKDLYVAHLDGPQECIIDDSVLLPNEPGVHELQIVYVFDPYKSLLRNEVPAAFVMASQPLGIKVP